MDKAVDASGSAITNGEPMTASIKVEANNASNEQSGNIAQQQQPVPYSEKAEAEGTKSNKRKQTDTISVVWKYFEKIKVGSKLKKGKCLYYAKSIGAETRKHGTSSLRNHILQCMKNPMPKAARQKLLTFESVSAIETEGALSMGVIRA